MPQQLVDYINQYGYAILFLLVFLQEIGVPSFPNEITLYYFGYLASKNNFSLALVLLVAILADILGAFLVYFSFYFFGQTLKKYKPSWLKISSKKITSLKLKMIKSSHTDLLLIRLTPFVRGYISVIAGIMHLPSKKYSKAIILSSFLWTGGWIVLGFITSQYFQFFINSINHMYAMMFILLIFIFPLLCKIVFKIASKKTNREL
ncbi:MAG: DedA family protein [Chitinophagaceae bacterium]